MANTLWDKIEAKFTELKAALSPQSQSASAEANQKTISDFRTELDSMRSEVSARDGEIVKLKAELQASAGTITTLEAGLKSSAEAQIGFDVKVETAASAKAQEILAKTGHPGIKIEVKDTPGSDKPNTKDLKGKDRFLAGFSIENPKLK